MFSFSVVCVILVLSSFLIYLFSGSHIYLLTFAYVLVRLFIQSVFVELLVVYILLWIPSGVFYDDFPLLSPTASAENADATVSAFLDALGWQHAKTGAKGRPFAHEFDVLGMCHTYIYIYTQLHIHTPCYMPLYKPRGSEALMQASRALNHVYHNQEP